MRRHCWGQCFIICKSDTSGYYQRETQTTSQLWDALNQWILFTSHHRWIEPFEMHLNICKPQTIWYFQWHIQHFQALLVATELVIFDKTSGKFPGVLLATDKTRSFPNQLVVKLKNIKFEHILGLRKLTPTTFTLEIGLLELLIQNQWREQNCLIMQALSWGVNVGVKVGLLTASTCEFITRENTFHTREIRNTVCNPDVSTQPSCKLPISLYRGEKQAAEARQWLFLSAPLRCQITPIWQVDQVGASGEREHLLRINL